MKSAKNHPLNNLATSKPDRPRAASQNAGERWIAGRVFHRPSPTARLRFSVLQTVFSMLAALLLCATPAWAVDPGTLQTGGYFKGFFSAIKPRTPSGSMVGAVQTPLRLRAFWQAAQTVSLTLAYELTPQVQATSLDTATVALPRPKPLTYRAADLHPYLYPASGNPQGNFGLAQNLDRAFLTVALSWADLYIGRQPIAFGSAHVINPTDVIAPFTYEALDKEERAGVDAVRLRIPITLMGELDAGVVLGDGFSVASGAAFLRGRTYIAETDLTFIAMSFQKNALFGIDAARAIGPAGAWLEAANVWAGDHPATDDYFRLSTGIDYNFSQGLYAFAEYHYNGAGHARARDELSQLNPTAYDEGGVYLLGKHYLSPGLTYQATPLLTLTLQSLINLNDGSAFIASRAEYGLAEEIYLEAGLFYGLGRSTDAHASNADIIPRSEFGLYPVTGFTSVRIYF